MKLPKNFPLTTRELRAALSSRYWCVSGYGTKELGLCPIGAVAQLRGVPFEIRSGTYMSKIDATEAQDETLWRASEDMARAFGYQRDCDFLDALAQRGPRLQKLVIARLKKQGIEV